MLKNKSGTNTGSRQAQHQTAALRLALTYIGFLLICLALGLCLCISYTRNAEQNYWAHHGAQLDVDVSTANSYLSMMETYARQLSTDPTFVRFSNLTGLEDSGFVYTAYRVMQNLSLRQYGLANLPIVSCHIYLPASGYVISHSQFSEFDQFYRYYLTYPHGMQEEWLSALYQSGQNGVPFSLAPFTGNHADLALSYDIGTLLGRSIPAIVWFELNTNAIRSQFLADKADTAVLLVTDETGNRRLALTADGSVAQDSILSALEQGSYDENEMSVFSDMQLFRRKGTNGWTYMLALPSSMCSEALGSYIPFYAFLLISALLFGCVLISVLVNRSMQPLHALSRQLLAAQGDNAKMQKEMDSHLPVLRMSYLRKLLSGHVASSEEFSYIMRLLDLKEDGPFYVLYCSAYHQSDSPHDEAEINQLIIAKLQEYLGGVRPILHYSTPGNSFVVLLPGDSKAQDPLMDLKRRVVALHNDLAENHNLWFYAGVGSPCTQPQRLWESYEQARMASRCTAKNHIFLPYALIQKDTDNWYYPVEISTKLLHFITTGNRQQVSEMFALIHRENLEERRLSVPLLNFLLSDLKNTLFKARFQASSQDCSKNSELLKQLDLKLNEASAFAQLESLALSLCDLFIPSAVPSDPIPEIVCYLQDNFSDPSLCLSKLSGLFNISESYLSHLFKNRTGENFSVYLENLRMNEAARRLRNPDCNLSELYADLGYSNAASWRRAFKKRFGITPSEMRQQNK